MVSHIFLLLFNYTMGKQINSDLSLSGALIGKVIDDEVNVTASSRNKNYFFSVIYYKK